MFLLVTDCNDDIGIEDILLLFSLVQRPSE